MQRDKGDGMQPMHGDNISSHILPARETELNTYRV